MYEYIDPQQTLPHTRFGRRTGVLSAHAIMRTSCVRVIPGEGVNLGIKGEGSLYGLQNLSQAARAACMSGTSVPSFDMLLH